MLHSEAIPPVPQVAGAPPKRPADRAAERLPERLPAGRSKPSGPVAEPSRADVATLEPLLAHVRDYLPPKDLKRIREAYRLSDQAHLGQFRASGDPYITHPIAVAQICAGWRLDADVLMAALLHDVLEDTGVTKLELNERFGPSVAEMVDGLSKLDKIEFGNREQAQAESFRKMLLAMARDVRVILVKLADRLHNMRTLDAVSRSRQLRIAGETAEIYAPIANRLGLHSLYRELQDLSFRYRYPMRYSALHKAVQNAGKVRRDALGRVTETVEKALLKMGVGAEISSREKSLYSIYRKMLDKKISFSR
jgi:GTP pyrophosphokinase